MLRLGLLWLYIIGVGIYAWKDWYVGLCGLILLVAVVQHPDMPKSIAGIQGLNPWNLLFINVLYTWWRSRGYERLAWDVPQKAKVLLGLYTCVLLVSTARMLIDPHLLSDSTPSLISEGIINTLKWPILGLLLFDGCRSRARFTLGLACILALYFLIDLQVIRWMPISAALNGEELETRSLKILSKEVGYHRVNLSMMLAGAFWAMWATRVLPTTRRYSRLVTTMSVITFYAQALTAGRMGYVTWATVGLLLSLIRWRRYLVIGPLVVPLVFWAVTTVMPGVTERLFKGFSKETVDMERPTGPRGRSLAVVRGKPDMYTVTAGRTFAWPFVLDKISGSLMFGYGRQAMIRTGLHDFLLTTYGEDFPHPHNAYLELLLDSGWIGFMIVLPFYGFVLVRSVPLFMDSRSPVFVAIGGVTCALVFSLLVAAFGSQTFYPREGSVGMWCAIGLALRVSVERTRVMTMQRRATADTQTPSLLPVTTSIPIQRSTHRPGSLLRIPLPPRVKKSRDPVDEMLWAQAA